MFLFALFMLSSWLYAMYCFEYKWSMHGWGAERKLHQLEKYWPYFAGFGCPFTLATLFVPNFVSKGIFALLFPLVSMYGIIVFKKMISFYSWQYVVIPSMHQNRRDSHQFLCFGKSCIVISKI